MIAVTDDGLEVLEPSGDRTPIGELLNDEDDKTGDETASPLDQFR